MLSKMSNLATSDNHGIGIHVQKTDTNTINFDKYILKYVYVSLKLVRTPLKLDLCDKNNLQIN